MFRDVTQASALDFVHENGAEGSLWLVEVIAPGVGVLDFDGDGRLDVWAIQGGSLVDPTSEMLSDRLFRNVSKPGKLTFQSMTDQMGVTASEYGMGIATGDIDDDGDTDVFLANFGTNQLWLNKGKDRFELEEGFGSIDPGEWSVAASFIDANGDGALDLYVVNYVDFSLASHKQCLGIVNKPDYCAPTAYPETPDRLYMNLGNGLFTDMSEHAGIAIAKASGLGVISFDHNADGLMDLYVANDPSSNFLWRNLGSGRFKDVALHTASSVNGDGKSEASMGIAAEDYDQDCDVDIFFTNLTAETNTLLRNSGRERGWFADVTNRVGLGASSYPFTGFGTGWIDFDLDGDLDLFVANGAVSLLANASNGRASTLHQRNQLWLNDGNGKYVEVEGEDIVEMAETSRGAAFSDLDNDGDTDILVANNDGILRIYENVGTGGNHWIGIHATENGSIAYNARVSLVNRPCATHIVRTDGSYASAQDPRVVFGLGKSASEPKISIEWATGGHTTFGPLAIDRYHNLKR